MKRFLVILAAAAFAATAGAQANAGASATGSAAAQAGKASASASQATAVSAELTKKLSTKDARVGEEVVAKTTGKATLADGTKLPKGSKLIGHVTEVQAKSHAHHDAQLAFAFDHAVLRDGQEVPIHATMDSITAPSAMAADSMDDSGEMMGGGMAGGAGMAGGGGMVHTGGGGGLLGGAGGVVHETGGMAGGAVGNVGAVGSSVGGTANGAMSSAGSVGRSGAALTGAAGGTGAAGAALPVGNLSGVTFSTVNASAAASRSGVNGSAKGATATMLSAHGKNISLDSGSQMTMSVSPR